MAPNASASICDMIEREVPEDEPVDNDPIEDELLENEPETFILTRARFDGSIIEGEEVDIYENAGNVTPELELMLQLVPPMHIFVACINCLYPIAYSDAISDVINCVKHESIPAAYVVRMYELLHLNLIVESVSDIFWKTHLKCVNCNISLSIRSLNQYNVQVDEYFDDHYCIMFDASCVDFLCKRDI